jgi:hypothetical protein
VIESWKKWNGEDAAAFFARRAYISAMVAAKDKLRHRNQTAFN